MARTEGLLKFRMYRLNLAVCEGDIRVWDSSNPNRKLPKGAAPLWTDCSTDADTLAVEVGRSFTHLCKAVQPPVSQSQLMGCGLPMRRWLLVAEADPAIKCYNPMSIRWAGLHNPNIELAPSSRYLWLCVSAICEYDAWPTNVKRDEQMFLQQDVAWGDLIPYAGPIAQQK